MQRDMQWRSSGVIRPEEGRTGKRGARGKGTGGSGAPESHHSCQQPPSVALRLREAEQSLEWGCQECRDLALRPPETWEEVVPLQVLLQSLDGQREPLLLSLPGGSQHRPLLEPGSMLGPALGRLGVACRGFVDQGLLPPHARPQPWLDVGRLRGRLRGTCIAKQPHVKISADDKHC